MTGFKSVSGRNDEAPAAAHQPGDLGVSSITLAKLEFGVSKSALPERNSEALRMFILPLEIVAFGEAAAESYGRVRAALELAGTPIDPLDTLIAAQAPALNSVAVTNNSREFKKVPDLAVEDWPKADERLRNPRPDRRRLRQLQQTNEFQTRLRARSFIAHAPESSFCTSSAVFR